jgi:hypothetical protein
MGRYVLVVALLVGLSAIWIATARPAERRLIRLRVQEHVCRRKFLTFLTLASCPRQV